METNSDLPFEIYAEKTEKPKIKLLKWTTFLIPYSGSIWKIITKRLQSDPENEDDKEGKDKKLIDSILKDLKEITRNKE